MYKSRLIDVFPLAEPFAGDYISFVTGIFRILGTQFFRFYNAFSARQSLVSLIFQVFQKADSGTLLSPDTSDPQPDGRLAQAELPQSS